MAVETANNQKSRCELPVHSVGLWEHFVFAEVLSFCTCDRVSTCHSKANAPYLWETHVVRVLIPLGEDKDGPSRSLRAQWTVNVACLKGRRRASVMCSLIMSDASCCLPRSPSVPGMVGQGPPFTSQPAISSVTGVKPSISTVTTANQSMMPQQPVAPNQQQPVPPQGQPVPNQPPQAPPQQQPAPNQPTAPSAQPNMVGYDVQHEVSNT